MIKYIIKNIAEISDEEYEKSYSCMTAKRKEKVDRFKNETSKKCTLAGEWLSRQLLSEVTGQAVESIIISADEYGKLHSETTPDYFFNISHSQDMVVSVVSDRPIGVDIEIFRPVPLKLAKKFCSSDELKYIFGKTPRDTDFENPPTESQMAKFFEIWTIKEAYFKCIGTGITEFDKANALSSDFNKLKIRGKDYIIHFVTLK